MTDQTDHAAVGRALIDRFGDIWRLEIEGVRLPGADDHWTREQVEREYGPLQEVLLVAQEPTTAEETTMADQTRDRITNLHQQITAAFTTLHTLAEECEAHANAWDERDDPDGHAATWDALHTLLTAAGAWVEHLGKVRPDLAPAAEEDVVAAVRRLATHLTAVLPDHDARVRADERQRMEAAGWRPPIRHGDPHMLAAVYGYELGEQEERRRLAELLAAVDRALAKARREYVRSAERDGQDPGPEGECWAEFEALAHVARQHATTAEGDHHA